MWLHGSSKNLVLCEGPDPPTARVTFFWGGVAGLAAVILGHPHTFSRSISKPYSQGVATMRTLTTGTVTICILLEMPSTPRNSNYEFHIEITDHVHVAAVVICTNVDGAKAGHHRSRSGEIRISGRCFRGVRIYLLFACTYMYISISSSSYSKSSCR